MSLNWGPRYLVPSVTLEVYSGSVRLREEFDEELLDRALKEMGIPGPIIRINNPWYYRKKNTDTWIMIGESDNKEDSFSVRWDTTGLENGQYEIMGLMHVFAKKGNGEKAIARQNIVEVTVKNQAT
jgi:hypothetical protein